MLVIKTFLNQNWVGTTIGLASFVIATIVTYWLRPQSRLAVQTNTFQLLGRHSVLPKDLEFVYKGKSVQNVALSRVALWNIGNTTIQGNQIVHSDPLRVIIASDSEILDASIHTCTRAVNEFRCNLRPGSTSEVLIGFDFLDARDGGLVQIIHTGSVKVQVVGTVRGVPKGILRVASPHQSKIEPHKNYLSVFWSNVIFLTFAAGGLALLIKSLIDIPTDRSGIFGGFLVIGLGLFLFFAERRSPPRPLTALISYAPPSDDQRKPS
jgi:hypothetical protein